MVTESVVDEFEPGRRFTFRDGAELAYTLDADLRGIWVAASPYLRWSGPRTMARSPERLWARRES